MPKPMINFRADDDEQVAQIDAAAAAAGTNRSGWLMALVRSALASPPKATAASKPPRSKPRTRIGAAGAPAGAKPDDSERPKGSDAAPADCRHPQARRLGTMCAACGKDPVK